MVPKCFRCCKFRKKRTAVANASNIVTKRE